jgi:hypothetical protein
MRSAPAGRSSERPKISFVFPVHDPEYGGGLLGRTQTHIDALIEWANRYCLLSEIIIVEWNPRPDRPPFRESLRWPDDLGHVCLRFLEVPAEIHRTLPNADRIPIFEYIAKNAGLRRARGQFLLATNPDLFYSPALMRWLARASLSPERFYRVDRRDLSEEIPTELSLSHQLRFCSQHVAHVHALFGTYRAGDVDGGRRLSDEYERWVRDTTGAMRRTEKPDARLILPADGLHRNAAGDFFLMERAWWYRLRGYPELYTHAHIDAILCWMASSAGLVQEILPSRCHLFHQVHHRSSHADFPQTDWKPWYERYREALRQRPSPKGPPMVVNFPDWGLANEALREWRASPRLVEVQQHLADEPDELPKRLGSSLDAAENAERTFRDRLTETETSLAMTQSDLQQAQAWLEEAVQKQAALGAALREAQSAREAERAAAEGILRKAHRTHKAERSALKTALREAQIAQRAEAALRHKLESSTAWRVTWPIRRTLTSFQGFQRILRRSPRSQHVEHGVSKVREHDLVVEPTSDGTPAIDPPAAALEVGRHASPVAFAAVATTHDGPPALPQLPFEGLGELDPLRVFHVPGDAPRVSVVTDSISATSLFGGVGIALVVAASLARHLGARLRVITMSEPPDASNVAAVLTTHRITWTDDIEFVYVGPGRKEEVPVGNHDLFLTTSWSSTRCVLPIAYPGRIVWLLHEDERMLCASGTDRLLCVEALSHPSVRFAVNSRLLFEHLTQGPDSLPDVLARGVWFEPAFPPCDSNAVEVIWGAGKRQFLFYAQPNDRRNLYWRGLDAIGAALEENVFDPADWSFYFAGRDMVPAELPRGVRLEVVEDVRWPDYVKVVRNTDVGLCLMEGPHPGYLPLELAASGAVLVTNQRGTTISRASDSHQIIRVESSIDGLKRGIAEAVRAVNFDHPRARPGGGRVTADWEAALAPVLAALDPIPAWAR